MGLRTLSLALCVTAQYLTAENLETPDNHTFPRALAAMTPSEKGMYPKTRLPMQASP